MSAVGWLVDHTIGWVFDHTIGSASERVAQRTKGKDRQRGDLAALADALGEAANQSTNIGRGYSTNENYVQKARQFSIQALALSTRIPDEELGKLTKAATDAIVAYANDFMHIRRETCTGPFDAVMEHIRELQRRLG